MRTLIPAFALVGLGLAGLGSADGVQAEDFGPQAAPAAAVNFQLGRLQLTVLQDAHYVVANDGKTFGVDAGGPAVAKVLSAAGMPSDRITLSVDVLLLREGARVMLFDSGLGEKYHGALLASLKQAGVGADAVTDVLITHPHLDHIGGLVTAAGGLAFPNAAIRMPGTAWTWLQQQSPELGTVIAGHVHTFAPGAQLAPGVTAVPLAGHTPGHTGYMIVSGDARLLDIGDLAHSSVVSLAKPQWTVGFDEDAETAKATRLTELAALAKSGELVFAPHFPFPGVGHILAQGDAFTWKPGIP
jgi:glyoxylase-like metal-dependent hydrolase (beta-lactamase superfamily II)